MFILVKVNFGLTTVYLLEFNKRDLKSTKKKTGNASRNTLEYAN